MTKRRRDGRAQTLFDQGPRRDAVSYVPPPLAAEQRVVFGPMGGAVSAAG